MSIEKLRDVFVVFGDGFAAPEDIAKAISEHTREIVREELNRPPKAAEVCVPIEWLTDYVASMRTSLNGSLADLFSSAERAEIAERIVKAQQILNKARGV